MIEVSLIFVDSMFKNRLQQGWKCEVVGMDICFMGFCWPQKRLMRKADGYLFGVEILKDQGPVGIVSGLSMACHCQKCVCSFSCNVDEYVCVCVCVLRIFV